MDGFLLAQDHGLHLLAYRPRRFTVVAHDVVAHFHGHHGVALAGQHVEGGLGADDLAGGGYQRRVAEILADRLHFLEHLGQPVLCVLLAQLGHQVREHAAGNLRLDDVGVHAVADGALELAVLAAHLGEVFSDAAELPEVEPGVVRGTLEGHHHRLGGRLGGAV